jgi:sphingosine kinase
MASGAGDDPFRDPSLASTQLPPPSESIRAHADAPDTLAVGRNASLTLGTDSLIVLGAPANCTGASMR